MSLSPKGVIGWAQTGVTAAKDTASCRGEPVVGIEASWGDFRLIPPRIRIGNDMENGKKLVLENKGLIWLASRVN